MNKKHKRELSIINKKMIVGALLSIIVLAGFFITKLAYPSVAELFLATPSNHEISAALAGDNFTLLGTHPYASTQTTADGKIISTLHVFNNKIYMGYGDYGANTGPIHVVAYDTLTGAFTPSQVAATTEAIYDYRDIGGSIYAPAIDPSGGLMNYAYTVGEPWSNAVSNGINATHSFDMATLTGTDIWVAGSSGNNATLWRSLDGGTTWTTVQSEPPGSTTNGDFARYYWIGIFKGKLYVQAWDYYGRVHPQSKVYDGISWSSGPNILGANGYGHRPVEFAGKLVYKSYCPPYSGYLMMFDGTRTSMAPYSIYDFNVADNYLYIVGTDGIIRRTTDLSSWSTVAAGPTESYSVAVHNDMMYIGTRDSKLYMYNTPLSIHPTATPIPSLMPTPVPSIAPTSTPIPTESVPPTVSITNPVSGSTIARNTTVVIAAQASDNVKVAKVEFYVDGGLKCTDTAAPYECRWKPGGKVAKAYNIVAKAYDPSNNQSSSSVSVTSTK